MNTYIHLLAEDLLRRFGTDMSRVAVVFPNKRASLFLNQELALLAHQKYNGSPLWSPSYITISDLFRHHSTLTVADDILLVCRLYNIFSSNTAFGSETLDHFFSWGTLLLADFDDLDKNMADASKVFSIVSDLHALDNADYLSEEQVATLKQFFSAFSENQTSLMQQKFLQLWNRLYDIYRLFKESLRADGIAYEGMLYRDVATDNDITFTFDTYCFVGFNMLQQVEQQLFARLKTMQPAEGSSQPRALFYWDYDSYYLSPRHEAGHFIKQYLGVFPDALQQSAAPDTTSAAAALTDNLVSTKRGTAITYAAANTETLQARYVHDWLLEDNRWKAGARTAIVLCDESLLQTVVRSLPQEVDKVNITTGFPLAQTPGATLIRQLIELHLQGRIADSGTWRVRYAAPLLMHPYIRLMAPETATLLQTLQKEHITMPSTEDLCVSDNLRLVFCDIDTMPLDEAVNGILPQTEQNYRLATYLLRIVRHIAALPQLPPLDSESLFRIYQILQRLQNLTVTAPLTVDTATFRRLVIQIISSGTVPYHGEPIEGIQIMGVLETRCLDFEHILILSANEGNMPKGVGDASFVPHSVRQAYGMTTVEHKVGIYSYYFHRLLQRAADVTITYNTSTQGTSTGEMSRFMLQLMAESPLNIRRITLSCGETLPEPGGMTIEKDETVMLQLRKKLERGLPLAPTSFATYLRCPAAYYYQHVANLRETDDIDADAIDNRLFGTLFHTAAEMLYNDIKTGDNTLHADAIRRFIKTPALLERYVDKAFRQELFRIDDSRRNVKPTYNGLQLINRRVILRFLKDMLSYDVRHTPFTLIGTELKAYRDIDVAINAKAHKIRIGGIIDRLDCTLIEGTPTMRVIDYKTGFNTQGNIPSVEDIFNPDFIKYHSDYYLQTFLYSIIVRHSEKLNPRRLPVSPQLLFVQKTHNPDYTPVLQIGDKPVWDIAEHEDKYISCLSALISEIFNPDIPFTAQPNETNCKYCGFRDLCRRS